MIGFILVDESHRTQGGELHKAMKSVFKNGIYLAFTGNSILKSGKRAFLKGVGRDSRFSFDEGCRE